MHVVVHATTCVWCVLERECTKPPTMTNGEKLDCLPPFTLGAECTYKCNPGYKLPVKGIKLISCDVKPGTSGVEWNDKPTACTGTAGVSLKCDVGCSPVNYSPNAISDQKHVRQSKPFLSSGRGAIYTLRYSAVLCGTIVLCGTVLNESRRCSRSALCSANFGRSQGIRRILI